MSTGLIERLGRYGDDLDAAIEARSDDLVDAYVRSPRPRRRAVAALAVAAASVLLAGVIGIAIATTDDGPAERTIATEPTTPTETTATTVVEATESEALAPLFADGFPTAEFSDTVAMADGYVVEVGVHLDTFFVGSRVYGDPSMPVSGNSHFDAATYERYRQPLTGASMGPWDSPLARPLSSYFGATGANVARVELTDDTGVIHAVDTVEVPSLPGTRVWGLNVPEDARIVSHVYLSATGDVLRDDTACATYGLIEACAGPSD